MPEVSRFFGIVVRMYYADHEPSHFHVRYSGQKALIAIETLAVMMGSFHLGYWARLRAALHRPELMEDWIPARDETQLGLVP
ncbi:MAG TPA: DUF4160 domain-containing protein [Bryobacteraceae bacterium]|jgi:hypothetical protein